MAIAPPSARRLRFTKMQGTGNDFVVVDATQTPFDLDERQLRLLAHRRWGVGCDQILVVEPPRSAAALFRYRIFNSDGGEVEACGNGARCFVRYVHDKGLSKENPIRVETKGGLITLCLELDGDVSVDMGVPRFAPRDIPFEAPFEAPTYALEVEGRPLTISALSMGNPHAVQLVDDVAVAPVGELGPKIERHPRFPKRVNAGFMQVVDRHAVRLRVYERGAGETLACGTGACAAVVVGIERGLLDSPVKVTTLGGELTIAWPGRGCSIKMSGPAATVFEGEWPIP